MKTREFKVYNLEDSGGTKYFLSYAKDKIKHRGILFGREGFDLDKPFIAFGAEYSVETLDKCANVVSTVSENELVDFLFIATKIKE